jgi:DNA-binding MarR family transcriptional regulator
MSKASPKPALELAQGMVRLMLAMEAVYTRESRAAGLTAQQAQLLCTAARREAGLGEIADVLRCDRSNVSRLMDRISERGLAYRENSDEDGRVAVVRLSEDGAALVDRFEASLGARLTELVGQWPLARQRTVADALSALVDALHGSLEPEATPAAPAV